MAGYDEAMKVTQQQSETLLQSTGRTYADLAALTSSFSPEEWIRRAPDGGWSAAEIFEHVVLANSSLMAAVRDRLVQAPEGEWRQLTAGKDSLIEQVLSSGGRAKAGPRTSTFSGVVQNDLRQILADSHWELRQLLAAAVPFPLHAIVWPHGFLGPLSAFQWLLYIPSHTARHVGQMQRLQRIYLSSEMNDR